jgi:hypothetical protein
MVDTMISETVRARGHRNVTATHRSTFEVTRDPEIGPAADCIIAVAADKSAASLSESFKKAAASDDAQITAVIRCGGHSDTVTGRGSSQMTFTDGHSMVFRVSNYVCGRTVMIYADKAAKSLDRGLVVALASGKDAAIELRAEHAPRPEPSFDVIFEG